jgi:hypothetical protein
MWTRTLAIGAAMALGAAGSAPVLAQSSVAPSGAVVTGPGNAVTTPSDTTVTTPSDTTVMAPSDATVTTPDNGANASRSDAPVTTTHDGAPDNTNSTVKAAPGRDDLDVWIDHYSAQNNGRISREAYLDEMARRWDAMDANHQGLTPAQVSRMTGRADSNAPAPLSGTGVAPGNMGPGNSKGE